MRVVDRNVVDMISTVNRNSFIVRTRGNIRQILMYIPCVSLALKVAKAATVHQN